MRNASESVKWDMLKLKEMKEPKEKQEALLKEKKITKFIISNIFTKEVA